MGNVFSRLLLATEHTEFDSGSEPLALAMAHKCGAPLAIVLPLLSNPEYEMQAPRLAQRAEADAAAKLQALRSMAQVAGVAVELQVRRGPEPYREIVDEARKRGTDLIVIRRRGQRGLLANLLLGEMVRNVVTHAPCGVLVAPRGSRLWSRRVLVAIDPQAEDLSPVATATEMAAACALPLSIVAVAEAAGASTQRAEHALQRALSMAQAGGVPVDGFVRTGRPHQQVLASAREIGADLLVIGRHGNDALGRAWLGGVAQKLIGLADMPVLVCFNPHLNETPTP